MNPSSISSRGYAVSALVGLAAFGLILGLTGCAKKEDRVAEILANRKDPSYFRVSNLSDSTLDVVFGSTSNYGMAAGESLSYSLIAQEPTTVQVTVGGQTLSQEYDPQPGVAMTLAVFGSGGDYSLALLDSLARDMEPGKSGIYLLNGSGKTATLTVRDSSASAEANGASEAVASGPGKATFTVDADGEMATGEVEVADGKTYTVLLYRDSEGLKASAVINNPKMELSSAGTAAM